MELRTLSAESSSSFEQLWESFVPQQKDACVGHLGANFSLADAAGVRNRSIIVVDEKDRPLAAMPLFELEQRELRVFHRRIVSSGFEFPAHPLIAANLGSPQEKELLANVLRAVESVAAACNADDVRISYPAIIDGVPAITRHRYLPLRHFGYSDDSGVGWVLDLRVDLEDLNRTLDKSCRNAIRRAQKEGCSVRPVRDAGEWMTCLELAKETLGRAAPSERMHRACWEYFVAPGHAKTTAVVPPASDVPSNVVVAVGWNGSWYYWKSYNTREGRIPGANNLALWEMIASVKRRDGVFFELGSMEFDNPKQIAIAEFKRSFGGTPNYALRGVRHRRPVRYAALGLLSAAYHSWFRTSGRLNA
jgi:hypothetical protein